MNMRGICVVAFAMKCALLLAQDLPVPFPSAQVMVYQMCNRKRSQYLVQAPTNIAPDAAIVIYYHGYKKDEKQGMALFPLLREWVARKGWIYVSPREYEMSGLLKDVIEQYGNRRIFLAGASAGGGYVFGKAQEQPRRFSGLFLIGPALQLSSLKKGEIVIPTFVVYGDQDGAYSSSARVVVDALTEQAVPVYYEEIKGGGHNAPYGNQSWWTNALEFVTSRSNVQYGPKK